MRGIFKLSWIGAIIGFAIGGFVGGIVGYVIGAIINSFVSNGEPKNAQGNANTNSSRSAYDTFLYYLMCLSADIIFADGKIYQTETDYLRNFLNQTFGPLGQQQGMAIFERLKNERRLKGIAYWNTTIQHVCQDIRQNLPEAHRIQIIAFLAELSKSDGHVDATELKSLRDIAYSMGLDAGIVDQMFALGGQSLDDAYKVLGLTADATDDEIRRAYKKMVLQHHPDRVAHLGEEVKAAATRKMQEINKAKDAIFAARGMH